MRLALTTVTSILALFVGCVPVSKESPNVRKGDEGIDEIVWVEKGIAHEDVEIDLGYRIESADGARWVEPVAVITRDEVPVANAMVFNSLASADGRDVIVEELATIYGSSRYSDKANYAKSKLRLLDGTSQCVARFRIVLPDGQPSWTRDVKIPLK